MGAGCTPVAAVDTPVAAVASCLDWNASHCSRHVPFVVAVVEVVDPDLAAFDGDGLNSQRSYSSVDSVAAAAAATAAAAVVVVVGNSCLYYIRSGI